MVIGGLGRDCVRGAAWLRPVGRQSVPAVYRVDQTRVRARLHRLVLDELGGQGELDWSRCAIDAVSVRSMVEKSQVAAGTTFVSGGRLGGIRAMTLGAR